MRRKRIFAWARKNPALAAVVAGATLFFLVLGAVVVSLLSSGKGPSQRDIARVEGEPNLCARVEKLAKLEAESNRDRARISPAYLAALCEVYKELTHEEASPQDAAALTVVRCSGLANEDFAWRMQIETRLRRGLWPSYPPGPPSAIDTRRELREATTLDSRLRPVIAPQARDAWLGFAVEGGTADSVVLARFFGKETTQADDLKLYAELLSHGDRADWLLDLIAAKLGLLAEPLHVVDREHPEKQLRFLGVLAGERCAVAHSAAPHPPITLRSCAGLVPRRFERGELVLVGAAVRDAQKPARWLPVLVQDNGEVRFAQALTLDASALGAFMLAAPRFQLNAKGSLLPFAPSPSVAEARTLADETFPSFATEAQGRPTLIAFSATAKVAIERKCPKIDAERCDVVRGAARENRCALEAPQCYTLPKGAAVRVTTATLTQPEPCIQEYGEKTVCPAKVSTGVFVDVRAAHEDSYDSGAFVSLASEN